MYAGGMTLQELLAKYGMTRPIDLSKQGKLSRAYAHLIWTGKRHISRKMARHIEAHTGIPYDQLMAAIPPGSELPPPPSAEES
jgi:hypothetical protein